MEDQVQLQSEDGAVFSVTRKALKQSRMLSDIIVDGGVIKLQTLTAPVLTKVIEYLTAHETDDVGNAERTPSIQVSKLQIPRIQKHNKRNISDDDSVNDELDDDDAGNFMETDIYHNRYSGLLCAFDNKFLQSLSVPTLLEVTKAANYLGIDSLLDLGCRGIAGHMKGLSTEAIRAKFNIRCDFTPEEEERIRREGMWAQDF